MKWMMKSVRNKQYLITIVFEKKLNEQIEENQVIIIIKN